MYKKIRNVSILVLISIVSYIILLIFPNALFAHQYQYKNFNIHSDRIIDKQIEAVLDDAIRRLESSELYSPSIGFNLFLCNDDWRFKFFTRNGNAGGAVNFFISENIFIRAQNIPENKLIPPLSWKNPMDDRPLSYFIAHEGVHVLQRTYDRYLVLNTGAEILEGYADYIAKRDTSNLRSLIEDYRNNASTMDPRNGLYDKYHLFVGLLINQEGYDFERLVTEKPNLELNLQALVKKADHIYND